MSGGELVQDGAGILAKAAWPAKADGERLRYSVALLKVTSRNRQLTPRVLVLTDRTLCDVQLKGEKLSVLHRVQLEHLSGYSACSDPGSAAFAVHIDDRNDKTKDFLLSSPQRAQALAAVLAAYADRARRQLRRRAWDAGSAGAQALDRLGAQQQQAQQRQQRLQQLQQKQKQQQQASQGEDSQCGAVADGLGAAADAFVVPRTELLSAKVSEFSASEWTAEACEAYAREQFNTRGKDDVLEYVQELSHVKAHAASQLQHSVVEHYRTFIRTSNETAEVDEDLSHLRKQLIALKTTITALRETSFDFAEETTDTEESGEHRSEQLLQQPRPAQPQADATAPSTEDGAARVDRVLSLLARAAPSGGLDAPTLRQLLAAMQPREYREGETIVREGDAAQTFFVVDDGECFMQRRSNSSAADTVTLQRGCCFGANALQVDGADSVSEETVTPVGGGCQCLQLTSMQFSELAAAVAQPASALSDETEETLIELDVLVAERKLRRAVESVEEIKSTLGSLKTCEAAAATGEPSARATMLVLTGSVHAARTRAALEHRISQLHSVILRELSLPARVTRSTEQTQRLLKLLVRLGSDYVKQARTLFYNAQNLEIKSALQRQRFEGDIGAYVGAISQALFTALRRAIEKYRALFTSEHADQAQQTIAFGMTSSLVVWVVQRQLGDFCALLRRHIALTSDLQVVSECLGAAFEHCAELESSGFQLAPQLRHLMCGDAAASIASYHSIISGTLHAAVRNDDWEVERFRDRGDGALSEVLESLCEDDDVVCLTSSCRRLFHEIARFAENALPLVCRDIDGDTTGCCSFGLQLYTPVIGAAASLLETYVSELVAAKNASADQTSAMLGVVANLSAIVDGLLPRLVAEYSSHFDRPCVKLDQLQIPLSMALEQHFTAYCDQISSETIAKQLAAQRVGDVYVGKMAESRVVPAPNPSEVVRRLASQLMSVNIHARARLNPATHREVVFTIWGTCARYIAAGLVAHAGGGSDVLSAWTALTAAGRSQLALDVHFMIKLFDLCHSAPGEGGGGADPSHRPSEWQELERAVAATAAAEGSDGAAQEDALMLFQLLNSI